MIGNFLTNLSIIVTNPPTVGDYLVVAGGGGGNNTNGGGGAGASTSGGTGGSGNDNTGGGGGASNGGTGGSGGSGIVILSYADTFDDLKTIPGSLTYTRTVNGGKKIYKFTAGTGTVTA